MRVMGFGALCRVSWYWMLLRMTMGFETACCTKISANGIEHKSLLLCYRKKGDALFGTRP